MHTFQPVEPGVNQCAAVGPSGIECGLPSGHGTHVQATKPAPVDDTTRRHRAIDSLNRTEAAFHAIVTNEDSPMARVFFAICGADQRGGITDNELYVHPDLEGMPQSTIRPRRVDLETAGLIVRATDATNDNVKRRTSSGGFAQVWVVGSMARRLLHKTHDTRRVA